jgi:hypothetical protein
VRKRGGEREARERRGEGRWQEGEGREERGVADMWAITTSSSMSAATVAKPPSKTAWAVFERFWKV